MVCDSSPLFFQFYSNLVLKNQRSCTTRSRSAILLATPLPQSLVKIQASTRYFVGKHKTRLKSNMNSSIVQVQPLRNNDGTAPTSSSRSNRQHFPSDLYQILELSSPSTIPVDNTIGIGVGVVATWLPHGRAFIITDEAKFIKEIVSQFLRLTKMRSFTRQLNTWGFHRWVSLQSSSRR